MTDYFAVLDQPRRPWLEEETLKESYYRLTLHGHPDAHADGGSDAVALNQAYRVLQNPNLRIQHLLLLEGGDLTSANASVPCEVADLFWEAGALSQEIDATLSEADTVTTRLAQSLLKRRTICLEQRTKAMLAALDDLYEQALTELRTLDARWEDARDVLALRALHQRFSYLTRWIDGFREKLFRLKQS